MPGRSLGREEHVLLVATLMQIFPAGWSLFFLASQASMWLDAEGLRAHPWQDKRRRLAEPRLEARVVPADWLPMGLRNWAQAASKQGPARIVCRRQASSFTCRA